MAPQHLVAPLVCSLRRVWVVQTMCVRGVWPLCFCNLFPGIARQSLIRIGFGLHWQIGSPAWAGQQAVHTAPRCQDEPQGCRSTRLAQRRRQRRIFTSTVRAETSCIYQPLSPHIAPAKALHPSCPQASKAFCPMGPCLIILPPVCAACPSGCRVRVCVSWCVCSPPRGSAPYLFRRACG